MGRPKSKHQVKPQGKRSNYIECPEGHTKVEYLLRYLGCEVTQEEDYVHFKFEIIETTHPSQKPETTVTRGLATTPGKYSDFYTDFIPLSVALRGKDPSNKTTVEKAAAKQQKWYDAVVEGGELEGNLIRINVIRYPKKNGKDGETSWKMYYNPPTEDDVSEHG